MKLLLYAKSSLMPNLLSSCVPVQDVVHSQPVGADTAKHKADQHKKAEILREVHKLNVQ